MARQSRRPVRTKLKCIGDFGGRERTGGSDYREQSDSPWTIAVASAGLRNWQIEKMGVMLGNLTEPDVNDGKQEYLLAHTGAFSSTPPSVLYATTEGSSSHRSVSRGSSGFLASVAKGHPQQIIR